MAVIRGDIGKQVEADGKFEVAWIEIYQMIRSDGRNVAEQVLGKIAVRVKETDTVTFSNVLQYQISQQRCLPRAGFADDIHMLSLVRGGYAKILRLSPAETFTDCDEWFVMHGSKTSRHSCRRRKSPLL